jgi:hypothetical protein
MSVFPCLVYRCPGLHFGPPGTTYNYVGVNNEAELNARLADGWFASLPEAVAGESVVKESVPELDKILTDPADENAEPTREELQLQARELGLKFDGRTSNAKLRRMIERELTA